MQLTRVRSRRDRRDALLTDEIHRVHAGELRRAEGAAAAQREGIVVARCTVERLMRIDGLVGAVRGKVKRTTIADPAAERARDPICRDFSPVASDRLWVADLTYVSTWSGVVYVAFVIDADAQVGIAASVGTVGDSYDCESVDRLLAA